MEAIRIAYAFIEDDGTEVRVPNFGLHPAVVEDLTVPSTFDIIKSNCNRSNKHKLNSGPTPEDYKTEKQDNTINVFDRSVK